MTPETLNRLPEALTEPIALFNSATEENSYVAMLEIKSSKSATVILPVEINAIDPYESEINIVRSAYAKADSVTGVLKDDWFAEQSGKGNLLYVDKEKLNRWDTSSGPNSHSVLSNGSISNHRRSFAGSNSLWDLSNGHRHTVMHKADLVKLREEIGNKLYSGPRGTYMPQNTSDTNSMSGVMTLMQTRDKSTFLHESARVRLNADMMLPKGIADIVFARQDSNQLRYQKGVRH